MNIYLHYITLPDITKVIHKWLSAVCLSGVVIPPSTCSNSLQVSTKRKIMSYLCLWRQFQNIIEVHARADCLLHIKVKKWYYLDLNWCHFGIFIDNRMNIRALKYMSSCASFLSILSIISAQWFLMFLVTILVLQATFMSTKSLSIALWLITICFCFKKSMDWDLIEYFFWSI